MLGNLKRGIVEVKLLIFGAGSLGSVVGGFMAKAGHEVVLIGRKAHMDAVRRGGLRISGIWGEHRVSNLRCMESVEGISRGEFDLIVVTVKSYDTRGAGERIAPLVDDRTLVCSYQNGLGNAEILAETIGSKQVFGARAIYGVWMPEPGHAEVTVIAQPTALGTYDPETGEDRVREIAEAMNAAGLPTVFTDRIATVLWAKVAYNCALNPMSALLDVPYGEVGRLPETRALIGDVVRELYAVGNAMKIPLEPPTPEEYLELFFDKLLPPTAEHYGSMREDFRRKRRTEIDALNGAIVRYGEQHGVSTPVNGTLTRLVKARETGYLG